MNCQKGIVLGEAVWRYTALIIKVAPINHQKEIQPNYWNTVTAELEFFLEFPFFHIVLNSFKTDNLVVSYLILVFVNCRGRFNILFILKEYFVLKKFIFSPLV